jgi:carboxyl-terminal processing protease
MMSRGRLVFISLSLTTVFLVVGGSILASTSGRQGDDGEDSLYKYLALFTEVLGLVDRAYVDETEIEKLMAGAFEGTADALDPFSIYVPAADVERYEDARAVGAGRSGLTVLKERGVAYAMAVEKGSPADRAGIERGDVISVLQGRSTRETPLYEIQTVLAGPVATKIKMECLHQGIQNDVEIELEDYPRPGVELTAKEKLPVLTISAFDESTPEDVAGSLEALLDDSVLPRFEVKEKMVIDLRSLAGGSVEAAYRVAALFASGELGVLKAREEVVETFADDSEPKWKGDLVVLIDRGTQGPAEVLATVLQQTTEATLVGTFSFGHCGRLRPVRLSNGGRLLLTDAFYTGPDHEPIQTAIGPDVKVQVDFAIADEEAEDRDRVLEKGLEVLLGDEKVEKKRAA